MAAIPSTLSEYPAFPDTFGKRQVEAQRGVVASVMPSPSRKVTQLSDVVEVARAILEEETELSPPSESLDEIESEEECDILDCESDSMLVADIYVLRSVEKNAILETSSTSGTSIKENAILKTHVLGNEEKSAIHDASLVSGPNMENGDPKSPSQPANYGQQEREEAAEEISKIFGGTWAGLEAMTGDLELDQNGFFQDLQTDPGLQEAAREVVNDPSWRRTFPASVPVLELYLDRIEHPERHLTPSGNLQQASPEIYRHFSRMWELERADEWLKTVEERSLDDEKAILTSLWLPDNKLFEKLRKDQNLRSKMCVAVFNPQWRRFFPRSTEAVGPMLQQLDCSTPSQKPPFKKQRSAQKKKTEKPKDFGQSKLDVFYSAICSRNSTISSDLMQRWLDRLYKAIEVRSVFWGPFLHVTDWVVWLVKWEAYKQMVVASPWLDLTNAIPGHSARKISASLGQKEKNPAIEKRYLAWHHGQNILTEPLEPIPVAWRFWFQWTMIREGKWNVYRLIMKKLEESPQRFSDLRDVDACYRHWMGQMLYSWDESSHFASHWDHLDSPKRDSLPSSSWTPSETQKQESLVRSPQNSSEMQNQEPLEEAIFLEEPEVSILDSYYDPQTEDDRLYWGYYDIIGGNRLVRRKRWAEFKNGWWIENGRWIEGDPASEGSDVADPVSDPPLQLPSDAPQHSEGDSMASPKSTLLTTTGGRLCYLGHYF